MPLPRLLIEDFLPAAAIGVECMRERSTGQQPPDKRLHVWFARRPLVAARAAVLGSLLPADFPRETFERLLGFGRPGAELVAVRRMMDTGIRVEGGFNADRAFKKTLREDDLAAAHAAAKQLWGDDLIVIDPMSGGGSIPLESARLGFHTLANEYNPVACTVLEATIDYPFRFGTKLADAARTWAKVWNERITARLAQFYPKQSFATVHAYIFARTVPCPDTQHITPLVPDWHLLKAGGTPIVAEPIVNKTKGTWKIKVRELGKGAGQLREVPRPTYGDGKGISLFTGNQIPSDYIKTKAQQGEMGSALYAVALKTPQGLEFRPAEQADLDALEAAAQELARLRPKWERGNIIPTEKIPIGDKTGEPMARGMLTWADLFAPRQLLAMGVLVEELKKLRPDIVQAEGADLGEAAVHLLALGMDKFANWNALLSSWNAPWGSTRSVFDRHDFAFKSTFSEMAPSHAGVGLEWAILNTIESYEEISKIAPNAVSRPAEITQGSATNLPQIADGSISAIVVDPPYADNVQYSELADFFYVWLKRTQGHRRPEWFSTYLSDHSEEAVVNQSRHKTAENTGDNKKSKKNPIASPKDLANVFYENLMTQVFRECHRILRAEGALTVMFTHKKQEAWENLFNSLIRAGFTITATWPVKTESEHSLHQAKKNAAQSTVILVARKRPAGAGIGYFDSALQAQLRGRAREAAARLSREGLNAIDQLVGSFGPAIEVFSQFDEVRTDTGEPVGVNRAIDEAADAVSQWRIEQLAAHGLEGVEPEGRFALLCWDVLGAAEFRFNEAKLLGHAVGMDVNQLILAGLVNKETEKIKMLSAKERRRARALEPDEVTETLFGAEVKAKRRTKKDALKIHPNDPQFRTALDACHALALRYAEAGEGAGGIGSAKALARQQRWTHDSAVAQLMEALVHAAPEAMKHEKGKTSAAAQFPEFRAWHALLKPLFELEPPDWTEKSPLQPSLFNIDTETPEAVELDMADEEAEDEGDE